MRRGARGAMIDPRQRTRSGWWGLAFAAALCGEWALRRRGGAR